MDDSQQPGNGPGASPSAPLTDGQLVLAAKKGSRAALEALVRRYQKPIYFLCLRYVRDHDMAADLAQRTFIRVVEKLDDLRDAEIFRGWLFRIGANLALNCLRDNARFVDDDEPLGNEPASEPQAYEQLEAEEQADAIRRAVTQLPTKQRMTLELRIYEELSFREIAAALDTTEGAAKVNFHYAVRRLKSLLSAPVAGKAERG